MSDFPPIADYAFLSDCEDSCLIAPDGSLEWLCLPRPDSPSVFGALLDRSAGVVPRSGPPTYPVPHQRRYVPGTMVVETTWHTPTGWLVVQDLLVIRQGARRLAATRLPAGAQRIRPPPEYCSGRRRCISGKVEIEATACPCSTTAPPPAIGRTRVTGTVPSSVEAPDGGIEALGGEQPPAGTHRRSLLRPNQPGRRRAGLHCAVVGWHRRRPRRTRRPRTWPPRWRSGETGSPPGRFPITRGVPTSSGARSPSRA